MANSRETMESFDKGMLSNSSRIVVSVDWDDSRKKWYPGSFIDELITARSSFGGDGQHEHGLPQILRSFLRQPQVGS